MTTIVKGDLYESIDGKLHEIKRQVRQKGGYPFDPMLLDNALQALTEGNFDAQSAFPTTYDQSRGLRKLIELAVGPDNRGNINVDITQERFSLAGTCIRTVNLRVVPFLSNIETGEYAADRLTAAGRILADTGDLAGFQHDHPKEVEKYGRVIALAKNARMVSDGLVYVPFASVSGAFRNFGLNHFRGQRNFGCGILVRCESVGTQSL
ncbi:MAG: hypothetical protein AAB666_01625 [Patescibacteria group bacterium]|mgnify:CR=1 FL=1